MLDLLRKAASLNPTDALLGEFLDSLKKEAFELVQAGQIDGAAVLYRRLIDILPTDPKSHYNLAAMLKRRGDLEGALRHYQEAVRLDPDYILALFNVAELTERKGPIREALSLYRRALRINPEFVPALNNLAMLMALHPDAAVRNVAEAVQLAEKGCKLTSYRDPILLDTLGAAYAASGRYAEARKVAAQGLEIAAAGGNKPLADRIRGHMETYQGR
jgi:tetratricopeptide (TPR) repeat protein